MNSKIIRIALADSLSSFIVYLPLGIAFGILSFQKTQCFWFGPAMSLFVYGGSAQYMSIGIIAAKGTLWDIFLMTFMMNFQHIFYGIPFLKTFNRTFNELGLKQFYLIFSLTDKTMSALTTSLHKTNPHYCWWVCLLTHLYWMIGTLLGCILSEALTIDISYLDFTLTALFMIFSIDQAYTLKSSQPFLSGLISFIASIWVPIEFFLTTCMFICVLLTLTNFQRKEQPYASC